MGLYCNTTHNVVAAVFAGQVGRHGQVAQVQRRCWWRDEPRPAVVRRQVYVPPWKPCCPRHAPHGRLPCHRLPHRAPPPHGYVTHSHTPPHTTEGEGGEGGGGWRVVEEDDASIF